MQEPYYSPAEVDRIAGMPQPVIRNLQITQSYFELSGQMALRTGFSANWCTFATWASAQAGRSIRHEDLPQMIDRALDKAPILHEATTSLLFLLMRIKPRRVAGGLRQLIRESFSPAEIINRAGDAVARGNQKVYAEIGRAFAHFLETCGHDVAFDVEKIERFCASLRPGDPPDGQGYLRQAFTHYYTAFFSENPRERAQLTLLANLEIGFHEQTRLQPEIAEALEAALINPHAFTRRLLAGLFPYRSWIAWAGMLLLRWIGQRTALDRAIKRFTEALRIRLRHILTRQMMVLRLPGDRELKLAEDLKNPFPENLRRLEQPELLAFLARHDPTPDSPRDSGATDWADLGERLHYIAELFRCVQEDAKIFQPPFSDAQVLDIKAERRPVSL